jgi:predicted Rossmann fold flavoprotein
MIVVVGAGAAGLAAAIFASASRRPVTVIETTPDGGRKILISGGGRCNILPETLAPSRFVTDSPSSLVRRWLCSWPLREQQEFFERAVGIPLKFEPDPGKWFPVSDRARDVRDGLVDLAKRQGVSFQFRTEFLDVVRSAAGLSVRTSRGDVDASMVVIATGGLSVPPTGSTGRGLDVARALGHVVHDTYPALTPLAAEPAIHAHLSGMSLNVRIRARSARGQSHVSGDRPLASRDRLVKPLEVSGGFLFTHRGYSGPAVLDISHVAVRSLTPAGPRAALRVRWSDHDERTWHRELVGATGLIGNVVAAHVPKRLADALVAECGIPAALRAGELRREDRIKLIERLVAYPLPWTDHEGYKKAEVTGGGVALDEVDPRTLESRRVPGVFFCGEILDAFGPIGGHNFAWAWATGRLAGLGAAEKQVG